MKRITDPDFKYIPSVETDLRKTFARIRREQREAREKAKQEQAAKVAQFKRKP